MNIENLKKAQNFLKTIPNNKFDMNHFRNDSEIKHECDSVGCIVGWCTALDTPENFKKFIDDTDLIPYFDFKGWSYVFFGLSGYDYENKLTDTGNYPTYQIHNIWNYLFSSWWSEAPEINTIDHAIYRIQNVIDDTMKFANMTFKNSFRLEVSKLNLDLNFYP